MAGQYVKHTKQDSPKRAAPRTDDYDPFVRGRFPVGVRTIQALDTVRNRLFPREIWYPAAAEGWAGALGPRKRHCSGFCSDSAPRSADQGRSRILSNGRIDRRLSILLHCDLVA